VLLDFLSFHHQVWRSEPGPFKQQVIVRPFEHQLSHVVHLGVLEQAQGSKGWKWILTGEWFSIVVKINYIGFPEA